MITKNSDSDPSHKVFHNSDPDPDSCGYLVNINGVEIDVRNEPILQFGASVEKKQFCNCPNRKPGKIVIDVSAHESDCWIRKRLSTKGYTIDTSVTPENFKDGYSLGVAV